MFFRLFALVLLVLLGALLASWLGAQPGMLQLEWLGWQIEMRTSLAVAIIALAALALLLLDRFLRGLLDLPSWLCLLYTSPSPRDYAASRMPSSA